MLSWRSAVNRASESNFEVHGLTLSFCRSDLKHVPINSSRGVEYTVLCSVLAACTEIILLTGQLGVVASEVAVFCVARLTLRKSHSPFDPGFSRLAAIGRKNGLEPTKPD